MLKLQSPVEIWPGDNRNNGPSRGLTSQEEHATMVFFSPSWWWWWWRWWCGRFRIWETYRPWKKLINGSTINSYFWKFYLRFLLVNLYFWKWSFHTFGSNLCKFSRLDSGSGSWLSHLVIHRLVALLVVVPCSAFPRVSRLTNEEIHQQVEKKGWAKTRWYC